MARVWIEDRAKHASYRAVVENAKASGRRPPGRWRVRWYDLEGRPKAKTFAKKPAAEAERTSLESKLATPGAYRDPSAGKVKIREIAEAWWESRTHLKRSSRGRYREVLDAYVLPEWGGIGVEHVRHEDIAAWLARLLGRPGTSGKRIGASQVRSIHRVLSMTLDWAVKSNRIAVNPAKGVPLPRKPPADHVYLDHCQVERLASAAGETYRPLILLLAYTGLRWGEASALRVGDVDLAACRVHVKRAFAEDNGELYEDTPKDHECRSAPLPAFLVVDLKPVVDGRSDDELLFTAPWGGPLRAHNFRSRTFAPAVKAAGLGGLGVTPHKLRHTAASLAIAAGADVLVVQTMLGHANASMTLNVYSHLFPNRLGEVSEALDARRAEALSNVY